MRSMGTEGLDAEGKPVRGFPVILWIAERELAQKVLKMRIYIGKICNASSACAKKTGAASASFLNSGGEIVMVWLRQIGRRSPKWNLLPIAATAAVPHIQK